MTGPLQRPLELAMHSARRQQSQSALAQRMSPRSMTNVWRTPIAVISDVRSKPCLITRCSWLISTEVNSFGDVLHTGICQSRRIQQPSLRGCLSHLILSIGQPHGQVALIEIFFRHASPTVLGVVRTDDHVSILKDMIHD